MCVGHPRAGGLCPPETAPVRPLKVKTFISWHLTNGLALPRRDHEEEIESDLSSPDHGRAKGMSSYFF